MWLEILKTFAWIAVGMALIIYFSSYLPKPKPEVIETNIMIWQQRLINCEEERAEIINYYRKGNSNVSVNQNKK